MRRCVLLVLCTRADERASVESVRSAAARMCALVYTRIILADSRVAVVEEEKEELRKRTTAAAAARNPERTTGMEIHRYVFQPQSCRSRREVKRIREKEGGLEGGKRDRQIHESSLSDEEKKR